jgi:hypothetical protein
VAAEDQCRGFADAAVEANRPQPLRVAAPRGGGLCPRNE